MKAEKEEIAEEPFVIRPYLKSELAHLYNSLCTVGVCHAENEGVDQK